MPHRSRFSIPLPKVTIPTFIFGSPNGPLPAPDALAFADAEDLQKKIEFLRERVRTLEDALRVLQANVSDDPHPLLQGSAAVSSATGLPMPRPNEPYSARVLTREDEEFLDAFGKLLSRRQIQSTMRSYVLQEH